MEDFIHYAWNVLVALDRFINAIFGGDPKDTMSGRVMRYKDSNIVARWVYQFLNWIEPRHCEESLASDQKPDDGQNAVLK
ncbi:MAG TPA: hypothetical protein VF799_05360 [Geobacteraceae bacterium]